MNNPLKLTDEYFGYVEKYKKRYGENTVVILQNGSFFEMYAIDNDHEKCFPEITQVCELLDIILSRKDKSILENNRNNPMMAGFPMWSYQKYVSILLDHGYTVVVYVQKMISDSKSGKPSFQRVLSEILSPSIQFEYTKGVQNKYTMCVYATLGSDVFSKSTQIISLMVSMIDVSIGKCFLYHASSSLDNCQIAYDMTRILHTYPTSECVLIIDDAFSESKWKSKDHCVSFMGLSDVQHIHFFADPEKNGLSIFDETSVSFREMKKLKNQRHFLTNVYLSPDHGSGYTGGITDIIELLNLEKNQEHVLSFVCLLQFVWNHNPDILKRISHPKWIDHDRHLCIEHNSLEQLNMISLSRPSKKLECVFDVLNKTRTAMGTRYLRESMARPCFSSSKIRERHKQIQMLIQNKQYERIQRFLEKMCDIERAQRKIELGLISFSEFKQMYDAYTCLISVIEIWNHVMPETYHYDTKMVNALHRITTQISLTIQMDRLCECSKDQIHSLIFQRGKYTQIDELGTKKEYVVQNMENMRADLAKKIGECCEAQKKKSSVSNSVIGNVKLEYSERENAHYFLTTSLQAKAFQSICTDHKKYTLKFQTSSCKISSDELMKMSTEYQTVCSEIHEKSLQMWREFLCELNTLFHAQYHMWSKVTAYIDFICSGAQIAEENEYVMPNVMDQNDNENNSYIECKNLRHPLIEKILVYTSYIPNDVCIGKNGTKGYLVYGTNSCGKSVYMKSVGIAVIMCQMGYFVPCSEMTIVPFRNILTRMSGGDQMLKGQSSFHVEMSELNLILQRSTSQSLVLGDEICHGTENVSGVSLMCATLMRMCEKNVPFVIATHLHQLSSMNEITNLDGCKMKHLTIRRDQHGKLIYERKLKDGSGDATYGLEVARYLIGDTEFISCAEKIQRKITAKDPERFEMSNIITTKQSRYNAHKITRLCQICKKKATETHHIIPQKDADEKSRVYTSSNTYINIHNYANLVSLCHECHENVHTQKKLVICGYEETINGLELVYQWIR
jgi:DNA mismatch repair protein MutS